MLGEMGKATLLIFLAELGDKTQILAMAFALQYSVRQVLTGVALGSFLNHGLAVIIGAYLSNLVPLAAVRLGSAIMFLVFGLWNLRAEEDEESSNHKNSSNPVLVVALAFFLGELGDKTQLTAVALTSSAQFPWAILAGTVLGMVLTSLGGIFVGTKLGDRVPELALKLVSSFVFIGFGIFHLSQAVPSRFLTPVNITLFLAALGAIILILLLPTLKAKGWRVDSGSMKRVARDLHALDRVLSQICLRDEQCRDDRCPVGYCKRLIKDELHGVKSSRRQRVIEPYVKPGQKFDRRQLDKALQLVNNSNLSPELRIELRTNLEKLIRPH